MIIPVISNLKPSPFLQLICRMNIILKFLSSIDAEQGKRLQVELLVPKVFLGEVDCHSKAHGERLERDLKQQSSGMNSSWNGKPFL